MTAPSDAPKEPQVSWQVPTFDIPLWLGRRHSWCVVIPVINEGERIKSLLHRIAQVGIDDIADVIIVDGGSTDGSLVLDSLQSKGVRGLLCKTGPGKLSAQLRCAYAFAMEQGYQGVITIDGNDKDDPEAIPKFIDALKAGIDFVQASRFIPGGIAANTPKLRDFAIRWVHAPLLSLFSKFHWTDTTQGFRAYSRKMLLDPRVAPFRDVFLTYELLAYLSYRAPKLGYRCVELPTTRRYPETGKLPTKISTFKGNWAVFRILVTACLGLYDPLYRRSGRTGGVCGDGIADTTSQRVTTSRIAQPLIAPLTISRDSITLGLVSWPMGIVFFASWILLAYLVALLLLFSANVYYFYTPDSWYYWSISESLSTDHPLVSAIRRQYQFDTQANASFPPLWPTVIHFVTQLSGFGLASQLLAVWICFVAIIPMSEFVVFRLSGRQLGGVIVGLGLLCYRPFVLDAMAGQSGVLNILLLLIIIILVTSEARYKEWGVGVGLGLLMLNRFDNVIYIPIIFATLAFGVPKFAETSLRSNARLRVIARMLLALVLTISPLIVFNWKNFGTLWISDNSRAFAATFNVYSTDYISNPITTLRTDFSGWLTKISDNASILWWRVLDGNLGYIVAIALVSYGIAIKHLKKGGGQPFAIIVGVFSAAVITFVLLAGVGYTDLRYFLSHIFAAIVLIAIAAVRVNRVVLIAALVILAANLESSLRTDHLFFYETKYPPQPFAEADSERKAIEGCLKEAGAKNILPLFKEASEGGTMAYLGASTREFQMFHVPNNIGRLSEDEFLRLVERFKLDAIYERSVSLEQGSTREWRKVQELFSRQCSSDRRIRIHR